MFCGHSLIDRYKSPVLRFVIRKDGKHDPLLHPVDGESQHSERSKFLDLQCRHKTFPLCRLDDRQLEVASSPIGGKTATAEVDERPRGECREEEGL